MHRHRVPVLALFLVASLLVPGVVAAAPLAPSMPPARTAALRWPAPAPRARASASRPPAFSRRPQRPPRLFVPGHSAYRFVPGFLVFDERDPRVVWTPGWKTADVRYARSRQVAYAEGSATVAVRFVGTALRWDAITGPTLGRARVSVDGGPPELVDLYRPRTYRAETVWQRAGLAYGQHDVRVEWTGERHPRSGGAAVTIDGFEVAGDLRHDEIAPVTSADATDVAALGAVTLHLSATDDGLGVARTEYRVDGGAWLAGTVVTLTQPGQHVVEYRSIDFAGNVEQTRRASAGVMVRYEEDDPAVAYQGPWTVVTTDTASGGAYRRTAGSLTTTGGSVQVVFTGTRVEWVGMADYGVATVSLDGGAAVAVDTDVPPGSRTMWSSGTLQAGLHVLRIGWTGTRVRADGVLVHDGYAPISVDAFDVVGAVVAYAPPRLERIEPPVTPARPVLFSDPADPLSTLVWAGDPADPLAAEGPYSVVLTASAGSPHVRLTTVTVSVDVGAGGFLPLRSWSVDATTFVNDGTTAYEPLLPVLPPAGAPGHIPDGLRTFHAEVVDELGSTTRAEWVAVVDEAPPAFPTGAEVSLSVPTSNASRYQGALYLTATPAADGTDPAVAYDLSLAVPGGPSSLGERLTLGVMPSALLRTGDPGSIVVEPFTPYRAVITPRSPRGLAGSPSSASAVCVTGPRLDGVMYNIAPNKKAVQVYRVDLTASEPATGLAALFGGTRVTYDVYTHVAFPVYPGAGDLPADSSLELTGVASCTFSLAPSTEYRRYVQVVAKVEDDSGAVLASFPSNVLAWPEADPYYGTSAPMTVP